nr:PREDICTED: alpha carbonic anhydrase 8-like [Rhinolophus sinicus]
MGKKPKPSGPPPPRPSARPIPGSPGAKLDAPRPTQRPEPGDSPAPAPRLELEPRDGDLGKFFSGGGAKLPARRSGAMGFAALPWTGEAGREAIKTRAGRQVSGFSLGPFSL